MKRHTLLTRLKRQGCELLREGSRHTIFWRPATGSTSAVPRHTELADRLVAKIRKDLGIPLPQPPPLRDLGAVLATEARAIPILGGYVAELAIPEGAALTDARTGGRRSRGHHTLWGDTAMRRPGGKGLKAGPSTRPRAVATVGTTDELWNARTRNLIQAFDSEPEALAAVRSIVGRHGVAYAERIVLASEDRHGRSTTIAQGSDLLGRAGIDTSDGVTAAHDVARHA